MPLDHPTIAGTQGASSGFESGVQRAVRPLLLYVDDDVHVCRAFRRAVRRFGFDVDLATSASQALAIAAERSFPVIVTDLHMPGTDGLALIERLTHCQPEASYVVATGAAELELPSNSALDGAIYSIVQKPWDLPQLEQTLTLALNLHRARIGEPRARRRSDPTSILLIEDNPGDADLAELLLSEHGYTAPARATRLSDALQLLRGRTFDFVLADLSLPDARGLDVVSCVRRAAPKTAIVVLSGLHDEALAVQAVAQGAQDYMVKGQVSGEGLKRALLFAAERKRAEQQLAQLARFDQLTGLGNRTMLDEHLRKAISRAKRQGSSFGLMFVDLDGFKQVNDTHGHDVGDALLRQFGKRIRSVVREEDLVARVGGDEFAIIVDDLTDERPAVDVAQRLLALLSEPVRVRAHCLHVSASIGIVLFPNAAESPDNLLRVADSAMYAAKRKGRNCYELRSGSHSLLRRAPDTRDSTAAQVETAPSSDRP